MKCLFKITDNEELDIVDTETNTVVHKDCMYEPHDFTNYIENFPEIALAYGHENIYLLNKTTGQIHKVRTH